MRRILVQRIDRLGDMICALPLIDALKSEWTDCHITVLASNANQQIVIGHPNVDNVMLNKSLEGGPIAFSSAVSEIKRRSFDIAINLCPSIYWALVTRFAGIPIRVGNGIEFVNRLCATHPVRPNYHDPAIHEVIHNLEFLKPLEMEVNEPHITLHRKSPKPTGKISRVVIFVGSGGSNSGLTPEAISPLLEVAKGNDWSVCICGGFKQDMTDYESLCASNITIADPLLSISELVDLIAEAHLYIGGDTGPTHIASFLNRPMLTFFPEHGNQPVRWGSFSSYQSIVHSIADLSEGLDQLLKSLENLPMTNTQREQFLRSHSLTDRS